MLMHPLAPPNWRLSNFVHEIAHMSLCEDTISKLIDKQFNHELTRELRKRLDAKADRGQLRMSAAHVIQFPKEIMANRWVAERSRRLLENALEEACFIGTENLQDSQRASVFTWLCVDVSQALLGNGTEAEPCAAISDARPGIIAIQNQERLREDRASQTRCRKERALEPCIKIKNR